MKTAFSTAVGDLRAVHNRFDIDATARTMACLTRLHGMPMRQGAALLAYHETLLFVRAHPANQALLTAVERELRRLAAYMKLQRGQHLPALLNEGLPFADTVTRFSHDGVRWLLSHPHCKVSIDHFAEPTADLNAVLRLTLPSLERNETTASLGNDDLLDALHVRRGRRLAFLVSELGRLDAQPYVKDHLFDSLDLFIKVAPSDAAFSKAYNRLPGGPVFFQPDLLRQFDARALMEHALPAQREQGAASRSRATLVLKNTMALTSRETDPATYLDEGSLRLYDLERGLSVALFGMTASRQLPLESYVGFTLFKNGLPVAYGGAWVLGERANFGMNIFEPYRGGESGYMMCQVLRAYRQAFGVQYFEVDAHQFGLDNPEGIATGAFWFYYRYGFRPLSRPLALLAQSEKDRLDRRKGYRSSEKILLRFTESNIGLNFGANVPAQLFDVTTRVGHMVRKLYTGDRVAAERDCVRLFMTRATLPRSLNEDECRVLVEVALIARALEIDDAQGLQMLASMVKTKPVDLYGYQKLLLAFFSQPRVARWRAKPA